MNKFFKSFTLLAALLAICVVVLGAYVRLTDAGLGCPDWPGCYGTLTVPQSESAIDPSLFSRRVRLNGFGSSGNGLEI